MGFWGLWGFEGCAQDGPNEGGTQVKTAFSDANGPTFVIVRATLITRVLRFGANLQDLPQVPREGGSAPDAKVVSGKELEVGP